MGTRGRPMGRAPVVEEPVEKPVVSPPSHEIHDDGTYVNVVPVSGSFDRSPFIVGSFIHLTGPYPVAGWVLVLGNEGIRIRTTKDREPDIRECQFRTWDYIETHLVKTI